jgi:hypothetical protein
MVHSFVQVRLAMAAGQNITLLSAPGAAQFGGCLWWRSLMTESGFSGVSLLDCGDATGRALEALHLELPGLVLHAATENFALVAEIAAAQGALVLAQAPPALDLGEFGAERRLESWCNG